MRIHDSLFNINLHLTSVSDEIVLSVKKGQMHDHNQN